MAKKVAVVVVTYNRLNLLKDCVNALKSQSKQLDCIYIVNNESTDGTLTWLESIKGINILNCPNNGGSAGQYSGIKRAKEDGYNWIWCMDDDSLPDFTCFEKLSVHLDSSYGFIAAAIKERNGNNQFYHHKRISRRFITDERDIPLITEEIRSGLSNKVNINANAFVGVCFNSLFIDKIGLPEFEYFIWHDDTEYTYRFGKIAPCYVITDAIIYHRDREQMSESQKKLSVQAAAGWKMYFGVRNKLFFVKKNDGIVRMFSYAFYLFCAIIWQSTKIEKEYKSAYLKRCIIGIKDGLLDIRTVKKIL